MFSATALIAEQELLLLVLSPALFEVDSPPPSFLQAGNKRMQKTVSKIMYGKQKAGFFMGADFADYPIMLK